MKDDVANVRVGLIPLSVQFFASQVELANVLTLARVAMSIGATLIFSFKPVGLFSQDPTEFLAVVFAIGIDQDFRVAFIDTQCVRAAILLDGNIDGVMHLNTVIVFDDHAQGAGRFNGGVKWNGRVMSAYLSGTSCARPN